MLRVLDCDSVEKFYELAEVIIQKAGITDILDFTLVSETGKGCHIWLRVKEPVASMKFPALDIKAEGGYVVAPPSLHPSGKEYKFVNMGVAIRTIDRLADIGIVSNQNPGSPNAEPNWINKALKGVRKNARNDTCISLAGYFKNKHPIDITESLLLDWNKKNAPPLPENEVLKVIRSAYNYFSKDNPNAVQESTRVHSSVTNPELDTKRDKNVTDFVTSPFEGNTKPDGLKQNNTH